MNTAFSELTTHRLQCRSYKYIHTYKHFIIIFQYFSRLSGFLIGEIAIEKILENFQTKGRVRLCDNLIICLGYFNDLFKNISRHAELIKYL